MGRRQTSDYREQQHRAATRIQVRRASESMFLVVVVSWRWPRPSSSSSALLLLVVVVVVVVAVVPVSSGIGVGLVSAVLVRANETVLLLQARHRGRLVSREYGEYRQQTYGCVYN